MLIILSNNIVLLVVLLIETIKEFKPKIIIEEKEIIILKNI